ncbi:MAG: TrkA family potassium uptake protein [Candidatus Krumholzibacteriia bacterium]
MTKVVVIGLGHFGMTCAARLYDQGAEVLAIDRNRNLVNEVSDKVTAAIACDATVRANLEAYDVGSMDTAIVAMGNSFEASVLVTLLLRELGVPRVVAKAINAMQQRVLTELGAAQVVIPEEEMGRRVADHIVSESIVDFVELPEGYSLRRMSVPREWVGQTLGGLSLLQRARVMIVQIVRPPLLENGELGDPRDPHAERLPLPAGDVTLQAGDLLDLVATDEVLEGLQD